jgi:diguanylate cyclase (GGDEF)-like protein
MSKHGHQDDFKSLYSDTHEFLTQTFGTGPYVVYSYNQAVHGQTDRKLRKKWHKESARRNFDEVEVRKVLEECIKEKMFAGTWRYKKSVDAKVAPFYVLKLGQYNNQEYYGVFLAHTELTHAALDALALFQANVFRFLVEMRRLIKVNTLIYIDDVTGLFNQRKLIKDLDEMIMRYHETKAEFGILFIDIDHFKNVNDGHGHMIGTQLLVDLGDVLKNVLRDTDFIYRYGGDEFVVIVPEVSNEMMKMIGERILHSIRDNVFKVDNAKTFKLSASIGIARFPDDAKKREDILAMADQMMYKAKKSGRGKVCMAGEIFE